jgi:predicted NUDIX family phosphoesterase
MNNMEELVFAFPTDEFWKLMTYTKKGLIKGNSEVLKRIVQNGLFLRRSELEEDPSFKQIIPYAIISNKEPEPRVWREKLQRARRSQPTEGSSPQVNPAQAGQKP